MSYVRWSPSSDVYCYEHIDGYYITHVTDGRNIKDSSREDLILTLQILAASGLKIPDSTIASIEDEIMQDKHRLFYRAYHYLRDQYPALHFQLDGASVDELDSLIWSALGYPTPFKLNTHDLTEYDCSRLQLLCGEHGLSLFKMMLARRSSENRAYWEK